MGEIQKNIKKDSIVKYDKSVIANPDTDIIFNIFPDKETSQKEGLFILKYSLNDGKSEEKYEVALGKLDLTQKNIQPMAFAKTIRDYLLAQLKENAKGFNICEYCDKLAQVCIRSEIPFMYTEEGLEIITRSRKGECSLEKTYTLEEEQQGIKSHKLRPDVISSVEKSNKLLAQKVKENYRKKWMRNEAMRELPEEKKKMFDVGENIAELRSEESIGVILYTKRDFIIKNLMRQYEKGENISNKHKLSWDELLKLKKYLKNKNINKEIDPSMIIGETQEESDMEQYFRIKEKGIAIDVKRILEEEQADIIDRQLDTGMAEDDTKKDEYINKMKTIFDFAKQGRDLNTQFCYSLIDNGFEKLYSIIEEREKKKDGKEKEESNYDEIIQYLHLKEALLRNVKLKKGKDYFDYDTYKQNPSIQEFVEFVMKSDIREETKESEGQFVFEEYHKLLNQIIDRHIDSVKLYNEYAEKFGVEKCTKFGDVIDEQEAKTVGEEDGEYSDR